MINEIQQDTETRMKKSLDSLSSELAKMRTGRAHPSLVEHLPVSYYGTDTPLSQVASITVSDAQTLAITPWEKNLVPEIEKAIMNSNLGLNPATTGDVIRIPLPPLTEERRKEFVKLVKSECENARVSIRNIRRDANQQLKEMLKNKSITEDDEHRGEDSIQKVTDKFIGKVDKTLETKETELMSV